MERVMTQNLRENWQAKLRAIGFHFFEMDGLPYWDESAYYRFSSAQVDEVEAATLELNRICLELVDYVVTESMHDRLGIPPQFVPYVNNSWRRRDPTIYGRFDLRYDGREEPKLLEFNADTPTALFEASVVQYYWLTDTAPDRDQFNSIHERLMDLMTGTTKPFLASGTLSFTCVRNSLEDLTTVEYLRDVAMQAGIATNHLYIDEVGYDEEAKRFVDLDGTAIPLLFKLYPWEWLITEPFGRYLPGNGMALCEPPWKMILSNKAILPLLWELYPGHKNLLPAYFTPPQRSGTFVEKPFFSREGEGIRVGNDFSHGKQNAVYQEYRPLPDYDGNYPVIGSWIIGDVAAGMGIREDRTPITNNLSRFVPHLFSP
jgi:glutathionylspermidine synthase